MTTQRIFAACLALSIAAPQELPKFESTTNLVVINVTVRDRSGKPIEGLKKEDFTVLEDGKAQPISVFEFQRLTSELLPPLEKTPAKAEPQEEETEKPEPGPGELRYKDRRLLVLFFDMSSMKPDEQIRAQEAALQFLDQQMTKSDLVSMMTFTSVLKVDVDFTDDREELAEAIRNLPIGEMSEFADMAEGPEEQEEDEEDPNTLFVADMTEFNIFNTDRKLSALESAARHLSTLPEKKALVYFSSGVGKTGVENQSQLRATVNEAIKANVAFYPIDTRGLVATPPAGDASKAAQRGSGIFSGKTQRDHFAKLNDTQETLYSLAADTGGKALLDSNELTLGIQQAQKDTDSYYILGYYSTNSALDGRFRRIRVRLASHPEAKLEHRTGYYAAKLYKDFTASDKERQLEEALQLGRPPTDLTIALEASYFRLASNRYFVPLAVKLSGSQISLARKGSSEIAELDFIGNVRDLKGKTVGSVRDTIRIKLSEADAGKFNRRRLGYDTGFLLAPGKYRIKFLARDNQTGKMGAFETRFTVPDLGAEESSLRMSSVVWSNQRVPLASAVAAAGNSKKVLANHPLIQDGQKLVPSVTKVFRRDQSLYVYFEVYDAGLDPADKMPDVAASLALFNDRTKLFESPPVRVTQFAKTRPQVVPFQFQFPLKRLRPGQYTCQLNVVDEVGRKFAYSRSPLVLVP